MRRWTAGSTLTLDADCACKIDSLGGGVHTVVTGGGGFSLRGTSKGAALTLSGSGTIDINGVFSTITLAGTAAGGTVGVNGVVGTFTDGSTGATVTNNAVSRATVNIEADTALTDYDGPTNAELTTALGTADDAVLAAIAALNNLSAAQVWQYVIETLTAEQIMRVTLAVLAGKATGGQTTSIAFRDYADTKNRVAMTVDTVGNRSAVTVTPT